LEQLQSLALLLGHLYRHPGDVAARPRKAGNNTGADWISGGHHDRYDVSGFVRGQARRGTPGHDHVDWKTDQLGRERRKSLGVPLRKTIHEEMSLSFDIAEVAQAVPQSLQRWPGLVRENADFPKATRRLRSGGGWPRDGRAAKHRDELASPHSITSSARASSVGGIWMPSALAVLRLITNSYLVGACTGRSAGFSPLRMRSTYPAARLYWSI